MNLKKHIDALERRGYTVELDPEDAPGVGRITGHNVLATLPLEGDGAEPAWAHWASAERHDEHLQVQAATPPEPDPDEDQQMIDRLRARGFTVLRDA